MVNGTDAPASGAAGIVIAGVVALVAPANVAAVPENTVSVPEVMTTVSCAHRSVAVPLGDPLFDWVHVVPGTRVNVDAATVPVFLIVIDVVEVAPGTSVVLPPNLLIVEQVAALVDTVPPSVLLQVATTPEVVASCIVKTPDAAVFVLFEILATNPDRVPVIDSDNNTAPNTPAVIATGVNLRRFIKCAPAISSHSP